MLGGCISPFAGGGNDAQLAQAQAVQSDIVQATPNRLAVLATECPEIRVRGGAEKFALYDKSGSRDAKAVRYQAVIDKVSRNCTVSDGLISVNMGVLGRLLVGPKGTSGTIDVPVRFAVQRDELAVFSEKYVLPVTIAPPDQGQEFIKVVENVTIPYVGGENILIWVGFDPS